MNIVEDEARETVKGLDEERREVLDNLDALVSDQLKESSKEYRKFVDSLIPVVAAVFGGVLALIFNVAVFHNSGCVYLSIFCLLFAIVNSIVVPHRGRSKEAMFLFRMKNITTIYGSKERSILDAKSENPLSTDLHKRHMDLLTNARYVADGLVEEQKRKPKFTYAYDFMVFFFVLGVFAAGLSVLPVDRKILIFLWSVGTFVIYYFVVLDLLPGNDDIRFSRSAK